MTSLLLEQPARPRPAGSRSPRIRVCPPIFSRSLGEDMVDLASVAGLHLDPWQADTLIDACGTQEDGLWSSLQVGLVVGRQNGKGSILEAREIGGLLLVASDRLIVHTAHRFTPTTTEHFLRVKGLIENSDRLRPMFRKPRESHGQEEIEALNGSRIKFLARSRQGGRGLSGDLVVLDEALVLDGRQMGALMPTMSARANPQIWYASSAGFADSEQLLRVRQRALDATGMRG